MKTFATVVGTITLAVVVVVAGFLAGSIWRQSRWSYDVMGNGMMGYGMMGSSCQDAPCIEDQPGYGMMGGYWNQNDMPFGSAQDMPCDQACMVPGEGDISSLEDVETAVHEYVERLGYTGLEVTEVMEFERSYYTIFAEEDTGVGAMELLVDKDSGAVGPEYGPNMMWNTKYGMHRGGRMGMMGGYGYATGEMTVSPA